MTLLLVALIISGCATLNEWTFKGSDKTSTLQSISEFSVGENGVSHIPNYTLLTKVDAFKCGNPYLKLCVKSEFDRFDYECLGNNLNGLTKKQIELKALSIPEFNCSEQTWNHKPLKQDS
ncbi:hypothetical protein [Shewanella aegiceratis]|uniref:hypothetical protein n=1 Tax=Shewanella aegiceratis TaxID=2864203 RepID=UPI001C660F14|nr:hypothetical protein [Shewanella aegiceratis]QYJ83172.1 hypothetical protein K0H80_03870 [Shewanella aegiceratis]